MENMEKINSVEPQETSLSGKAYIKLCDAMSNCVNNYIDSYYNGNILTKGYNLVKLGFVAVAGVILEMRVAEKNKPDIDRNRQYRK